MSDQKTIVAGVTRSRITAPLYAVVFLSSQEVSFDYQPALAIDLLPKGTFRTPHMFDPDLEQTLGAIRFILFLPPTFSDAVRLRFGSFRFLFQSTMPHQIVLIPWPAITKEPLTQIVHRNLPFHWFSPPQIVCELTGFLREAGVSQNVSSTSELTVGLLQEIWKKVYEEFPQKHLGPPNEPFCMDPSRTDISLSVSTAFIAQRISNSINQRLTLPQRSMTLEDALEFRAFVFALDSLARQKEQPENPEQRLKSEIAKQRDGLRLSITIAAPGVPPAHSQIAKLKGVPKNIPEDIQRRDQIIELLTTHHAVSNSGIALKMSEVPAELYLKLTDLEAACRTENVRPRKIWHLIEDLSKRGRFLFEGETHFPILARAKPLQIFSDFPIGLLIPPGASAPLHLCVPTIYRPLTPLTRALQFELHLGERIDLSNGFRVLLAECIDPRDRVALLSWNGLSYIKTTLDYPSSRCIVDLRRIASPQELAMVLEKENYDVLVLSAHGIHSKEGLWSSLLIGQTPSMLEDVVRLPPIVFLSACHTAPRGRGAVSVADILIRKGAVVILGTLIPVRVDRSAILMQRLLLYMEQAVAGNEPLYRLDEALHKALALNAVHDIETMSKRVMDWMERPYMGSGRTVMGEFKQQRSQGRLRPYHIYRDTEKVLLEMATEMGEAEWIRAQLTSLGFLPETAFYVLIGSTDEIILQLTDFERKYMAFLKEHSDPLRKI